MQIRTHRTRGIVVIALVALGTIAASCSDKQDTASSDKSPTTSQSATQTMAPTGPGCASVPADGKGSFSGMSADPAATAASNNPLLSTLVSAVKEAGLVDTLNGAGPFTIFAPTNDAFAKIPSADLDAAMADKATLTKILTLHVIAGKELSSADLVKDGKATTVEGDDLTFTKDGDSVKINGMATTVCADVHVANATVHIIDSVLMPGSDASTSSGMQPTGSACSAVPADGKGSFSGMAGDPAATAASNNPVLSTLVTAVKAAGLVDTLNGPGPFTIFAPTNDAFAKIPADTLNSVLADVPTLTKILTLHVISGQELSSADLVKMGSATSVEGEKLTFEKDGDAVKINGMAATVCADVHVANATVHIIDSVLMPS